MEFFYWKTCDTEQSIPLQAACRGSRTFYLILPNGHDPIIEHAYQGNCIFGDEQTSAFTVLANLNFTEEKLYGLSEGEVNELGIHLACGASTVDKDGNHYICLQNTKTQKVLALLGITNWTGFSNPESVITVSGVSETVNNHSCAGRLSEVRPQVKFPLKFSFNPDCVYEDHVGSKVSDKQELVY